MTVEPYWLARLREAFDRSGRKMKHVSIEAGLNETYLRDVLRRRRVPSVTGYIALAEVLGTDASTLLAATHPKTEDRHDGR